MKAIIWDEASQGMKFTLEDIPADLVGRPNEWRERWWKLPPRPMKS